MLEVISLAAFNQQNPTTYGLCLPHHKMEAIKKAGKATKCIDRQHTASSPKQK